MKSFRVLALTVFAMLLATAGCSHQVSMVVTPGNLTGGTAKAGDVLVWTTLYPDGPGYTVKFKSNFPCKSPLANPFHVDPGAKVECIIVAPAGATGSSLSFTYQTFPDPPKAGDNGAPAGAGSTGGGLKEIPFAVIPCKTCLQGPGGGDGSTALAMSTDVSHEVDIACDSSSKPAHADDVHLTQDGTQTQFAWWASDGEWTAKFSNGTPCAGGSTNFSNNGPSRCVLTKDAKPGTYQYAVTSTTCNGAGTANFIVDAQAQPIQ